VTLLGQGVGLGDPQRALPTPGMLGFCETHVSVVAHTDVPTAPQGSQRIQPHV